MIASSTPVGAAAQVARLLRLVPLLHGHSQVRVSEAAELLEVTPRQVVRDLRVLFMCGLPGGYPDDLIDVDLDALEGPHADGVIRVSNAEYLARPLRLSTLETGALVLALRSLRSHGDPATHEVVARTVEKLTRATGIAETPVAFSDEPDPVAGLVGRLQHALAGDRQVRIVYWVPSRDEESERVVDPFAVERHNGADYLKGWCHQAGAERSFRLDRIHRITELDSRREVTSPTPSTSPPDGEASGRRADPTPVTLRLAPPAHWVADYYRTTARNLLGDGSLEISLEVWESQWLERLLLRLAPHVRAVTPEALGRQLADRTLATLALYPDA